MRPRLITALAILASYVVTPAPAAETTGEDDTFRDCDHCPEMVPIPAGSFDMGADTGRPHEQPVHRVTVERPFAVSIFPITVAQFREFARARPEAVTTAWCEVYIDDGSRQPDWDTSWEKPGFEQGDDHPVVCVSWIDVVHYLRWLSGEAGRTYRLLTEAEWEYVARANADPQTVAHHGRPGNANLGSPGREGAECCFGATSGRDEWEHTAPVDAFGANGFGVYDMSGNTMDLVADCVNHDYLGAPTDGSAWMTPDRIEPEWASFGWTADGLCFGHMQRGRAWAHPPRPEVWQAWRGWWYPSHAANFFGFRVAVSLTDAGEG